MAGVRRSRRKKRSTHPTQRRRPKDARSRWLIDKEVDYYLKTLCQQLSGRDFDLRTWGFPGDQDWDEHEDTHSIEVGPNGWLRVDGTEVTIEHQHRQLSACVRLQKLLRERGFTGPLRVEGFLEGKEFWVTRLDYKLNGCDTAVLVTYEPKEDEESGL